MPKVPVIVDRRLREPLAGADGDNGDQHLLAAVEGREFEKLGHDVRLIPPIYVTPFVKRGK